jgi:hypothetical protein
MIRNTMRAVLARLACRYGNNPEGTLTRKFGRWADRALARSYRRQERIRARQLMAENDD